MMNKQPIVLKPCPKCGKNMKVIGYLRHSPVKEIACLICGFKGKKALTVKGAARNWNKAWKKVQKDG